jgi:hypothetical protein
VVISYISRRFGILYQEILATLVSVTNLFFNISPNFEKQKNGRSLRLRRKQFPALKRKALSLLLLILLFALLPR